MLDATSQPTEPSHPRGRGSRGPTIYEVAAVAGVSASTVSRALNGIAGVSREKQRRVQEAADSLGFTVNGTARSFRRQYSSLIALLIPDIENPFFTGMARAVEDVAHAAGFSVVLCNTDEDEEKESRYLEIALSENMAGVILAPAAQHTDLNRLIGRGRPIVTVDRGHYEYDVDAVMVDNEPGSYLATRDLIEHGHRRVACITGPSGVDNAEQRAAGWMRATGLSADAASGGLLRHTNYRVDGGYSAMIDLLDAPEPPDAVFVANNMMAIGALRALSERGLEPPRFGVASFGAVPFASVDPAHMVTVELPARQIGHTAATVLLGRIAGDARPPQRIVLATSRLRA